MSKLKFVFLSVLFFISGLVYAGGDTAKGTNATMQDSTGGKVEMADAMRADGKIYVVVSVLLIILAGILLYLISIDRKVKRMEKNIEEKK